MRIFLTIFIFIIHSGSLRAEFVHPERFEAVKKRLIDAGVAAERVESIFSSEKAKVVNEKAVELIEDMSRIKLHRRAEQMANKALLLKSALLKKHLKKYKCVYDQVEEDFGVNREIVAAILQKETALGAFRHFNYDAFVVLMNMLDRLELGKEPTPRRIRRHRRLVNFASENLVALILFYEKQGKDITKIALPSSYAAAMGIPQFTPQHFDMIKAPPGEGLCDISYMPTAIYSTANLLKNRFGWGSMIDFSKISHLNEITKQWYEFDDGTANFVHDTNLDGMKVPNFVAQHQDDEEILYLGEIFKVLMRYNFSTAYAIGIIKIAKKSHE